MFEKTDAVCCNEVLINHMQMQSYLHKIWMKKKIWTKCLKALSAKLEHVFEGMTPTCAWCLAATPAYNAAGNRKVLTYLTQPKNFWASPRNISQKEKEDNSYLEVKDDGPNEAKS